MRMHFWSNIFLKSVLTLMVGTALAQIISVAITPVITRLYTPAQFGILDLFVSIIAILSSITSLKYDQAIVIAKENNESFLLTKLTIIINGIICLTLLLLIALFSRQFSIWLGNESIRFFLFLIPFVIFFSSFFSASKNFAIRLKNFRIISNANVLKSLLSSFVQVILGLFKIGTLGLISGPLSSAFFINGFIYRKVTKGFNDKKFKFWQLEERKQYVNLMRKYKDFPKYSVVSSLANTLVLSGTSVFIFKMFSAVELGYLALAQRLLSIPLNLISGAVGDVFFQKVSEEKEKIGNAKRSFLNTFKFLALIAIIGALAVYFVLPYIFGFIFGSSWTMAGYYASILVFLYAIRFINTPLSTTFIVFEKQKELLMWTLVQLLILIITVVITIKWNFTFDAYIKLYVLTQSLFYLLFLYRSWNVSRNKNSVNEKS